MKRFFVSCSCALFALCMLLLLAGCGGGEKPSLDEVAGEEGGGLTKVRLQTDWYAQPEHGGFYQAVVQGFYEEEGLEVEIIPGGPNVFAAQKLAKGTVEFALGRSDDVIIGAGRGLPLVMVGALMQRDPQALMFHAEAGIEGFEDLDGRTVMAGAGSAFIELIERTYDIELAIIPLDYGMTRFLADKEFVQQAFITNEPYYVRREGANPETLLISDSGFRPYRVWYTSRTFARRNPEVVAAFTRASIRGWKSYIEDDPAKANEMIAERNPKMSEDFMAYSRSAMIKHKLIGGETEKGEAVGLIRKERIAEQIEQLESLGMLDSVPAVGTVFDESFLPEELSSLPEGSEISLHEERADWSDLAVYGPFPGVPEGEARYLRYDELAALPVTTATMQLEVVPDRAVEATVLPLAALKKSLGLGRVSDYVLADCSDAYQSNYTRTVLDRNRPFLLLAVEGTPLPEWVRAQGNAQWGPYMIQITETAGLLDPVNKNPWGVESLTFLRHEAVMADLRAKIGEIAAGSPAATGLDIYMGNCASCHRFDSLPLGGGVSDRPFRLLSVFAQTNPDYVVDMLRDPVGTNPLAEKMPAAPHYEDSQVRSLLTFLQEASP